MRVDLYLRVFLPAASGPRRARLQTLSDESRTLVFYEAPHRIEELLNDLAEILGAGRTTTLARELTKSFETICRGALSSLVQLLGDDDNQRKGEFVVVVEGAPETTGDDQELNQSAACAAGRAFRQTGRVHRGQVNQRKTKQGVSAGDVLVRLNAP